MKELEDPIEQNRTGTLLKATQKATSCGELDGNELVTLEQLQEVDLTADIILHLLLIINSILEYVHVCDEEYRCC